MSCLCLIHVQIKDLLCSEDVQTQLAGSLFVGLTTAFHMRKVERNEKSQVSLSPYSCCVNGTHWHDISRLKPSVLPPPPPLILAFTLQIQVSVICPNELFYCPT